MEDSFEKSSQRLKEHYGFTLPLSAVANLTRAHARGMSRRQEKTCENAGALPREGADEIIAEADGSFLRIVSTDPKTNDLRKSRKVDFREARLCASAAKGSDKVYYDATFGPVDTVAKLWAQTAKMAGMSLQSHIHTLADGAIWIDLQRRIAFGERGELLIDLYHVLEYLGAAAPGCSDRPKQWLKTQKKRLKKGQANKVINELKEHREEQSCPEEDSPVRRAWRYLSNRSEHLAYHRAIEKNLPLGSGMIESGNKHVLQARMKIPGAAWNIDNAENFARARALRANHQWEPYWDELKKAA